ncbi:MAG: thiosulfate oxidation carrier complex protein SoxZ [Gammaproteobacteria bacterium]|nr:thiosulfate oxidation carrier complex protein SoxZ [Gammaproteobacteria bacterium]
MLDHKNSLKVRIGTNLQGESDFKCIIAHPMETGYRKDSRTNQLVPADYIALFTVHIDNEPIYEITLNENISRNPFLYFTFSNPLFDNQLITIRWVDNQGRQTEYEYRYQLNGKNTREFIAKSTPSRVPSLVSDPGPACKTNLPASTH